MINIQGLSTLRKQKTKVKDDLKFSTKIIIYIMPATLIGFFVVILMMNE